LHDPRDPRSPWLVDMPAEHAVHFIRNGSGFRIWDPAAPR
jgi:hypothetical protein